MVDYGDGQKASHGRGTSLSFADIVGQTELKRALLAIAADDDLNGLLVQGEKGTAKSTAVRALTDLLPKQEVIADCPYGCPPNAPDHQCDTCRERTDPPTTERTVPLVTLPLGATRERVVGTLSVADALDGDYEFDPGLLARANRGILYVDEVNLLDDHLVDVLLDAAASGVNSVERDGMSVSHPAEFTLIGTMNPEEGDLRPQLRDRFALQATVTACEDVDKRVRIIDRAIGRTDGDGTERSTDNRTANDLRDQLSQARKRLPDVDLPTEFARDIAELCRDSGVDGHRGDIATARAAMTVAALDGRSTVVETDVERAASLALPHRLRSRPFEDAPDPNELIEEHFDGEGSDDGQGDGDDPRDEAPRDAADAPADGADDASDTGDAAEADASHSADPGPSERTSDRGGVDAAASPERSDETATDGVEAEATAETESADETDDATPVVPGQRRADIGAGRAPELTAPEAVENERESGSRSRTQPHVDNEGARVRSQRSDSNRRIDVPASVRAASARGASSIESRDLRQSVRRSDAAALVVFVVDASASMLPAMRAAKGTVLELLKDAYEKRDEVAFVAFAGEEANVLLPPTDSVTLASRHLKDLPVGDRTPLPAGLRTASEVLEAADPASSVVVLVTDGRTNVADGSPVRETREAARRLASHDTRLIAVDAGTGGGEGLLDKVVDATDGTRIALSALSAERVDSAVTAPDPGADR